MFTGINQRKERKLSKLAKAQKWIDRYKHLAVEYEKALNKIRNLATSGLDGDVSPYEVASEVLTRIGEEVKLWK